MPMVPLGLVAETPLDNAIAKQTSKERLAIIAKTASMIFQPVNHAIAILTDPMDLIVMTMEFVFAKPTLMETSVTSVKTDTRVILYVMNASQVSLDIPLVKVNKIINNNRIFLWFNLACGCDANGSTNQTCNNVGNCTCKSVLITGAKCDRCVDGYFGFPDCKGTLIFKG